VRDEQKPSAATSFVSMQVLSLFRTIAKLAAWIQFPPPPPLSVGLSMELALQPAADFRCPIHPGATGQRETRGPSCFIFAISMRLLWRAALSLSFAA
jgi:hypothetical protein